jgi:hypothetical protein
MGTEKAKAAVARLAARLAEPRTVTRIANARRAIERVGGTSKAAEMLGYANASYLSQMFGPNPGRVPTEKIVRRMEQAFGLPEGELDRPLADAQPPVTASGGRRSNSQIDTAQLSRMISLVNKLATEERVQLDGDRFASLVAIAYEESAEHAGHPSESKLRQVVQLLK